MSGNGKPTPLEEINLALNTLQTKHDATTEKLQAIHADVQRLLDPETGVYPKITAVHTELSAEIRTIKTKQGWIIAGATGIIMSAINYIVRRLT